ncbi:MAG: fibronectin type III domain-containing protein [Armatimonadetes bacterium]|nr:fibronectin type III domain-containing protein [Armatimonadota bacterium]
MRAIWVIGLMGALLLNGAAQTLVLTNGDVNGDNVVDDSDLLAVVFAQGQSCPSGCPEDLNGDGVVDDTDLLIVSFNQGAQGAPTFAGDTTTQHNGAFSRTLGLQLGDWVGSARQVKVQLKPVGRENDSNVPIYEWTFAVGGTLQAVQLTDLPAGVYTVRAFVENDTRWLRTEGKILTEVPWIFAVPTGANKVTVYWDPVPGATGYRVRWGTVSGSYSSASGVLSGSARQYTVSGLVSEREYYFVVEAEWNGVWGPPSEEDSAVPHMGAIPWDTQDPNQIIPAIRSALGIYDGDVSALSPDGWYYTETGGLRGREIASLQYEADTGRIVTSDGAYFMPTSSESVPDPARRNETGPFRRVETRQGRNAIQAMGEFYLPPPRHPSANIWYIRSEQSSWRSTRDTPYVYFGIKYLDRNGQVRDIEGGLSFHPAGRGLRVGEQERGGDRVSPPPNYDRWNIYIRLGWEGEERKVAGKFGEHLSYGQNWQEAPYGFVVWLNFGLSGDEKKLVFLHLHAWRYILDDLPSYKRVLVGCAHKEHPVPPPGGTPQVRRVVSIAQDSAHARPQGGWVRTGSLFLNCGVAYAPLFIGQDLQELSVYLRPTGWQPWTGGISNPPEDFPETGIISAERVMPWYREVVSIRL